jgi:hypothetical protein
MTCSSSVLITGDGDAERDIPGTIEVVASRRNRVAIGQVDQPPLETPRATPTATMATATKTTTARTIRVPPCHRA